MPELLIRPSLSDHKVIADLLAPSPLTARRPIDRIVVNAADAARRSELAEAAQRSGTPVIVDPLTMLLQGEVDPQDPWVRNVPFGRAEALEPQDLVNPFLLDELVARVVEFQVEAGASAIVPPYFYATTPDSPAFAATLQAIRRTARRLGTDGIALPVIVVLCAQLRGFAHRAG